MALHNSGIGTLLLPERLVGPDKLHKVIPIMIYNVKDYGATGNGTTDDTAAIQAAVNAAHAAAGGQVYIPAGTYIVHGQSSASLGAIMLYDNVTVYGDGMGASTVKLGDGWNGNISGIFRDKSGVANHDIGVHDLTIDGNRANTTGHIYGWFNGVSPGLPGTDTNITLDHVEIKDCSGYGFDPHEETTNLVITNCISHGNGLDGFTLDFQINGYIANNVAYGNDRHGFNVVTSTHDTQLINNIAHDNGGQGIMLQRGSYDIPVPNNILIQGGSLYNNAGDGIQINKADHITVDGVDIHDNVERGVRIIGSVGTIVENSTIYSNSDNKNQAFEEIRIESYNDTAGVSGRVYATSGTIIDHNTLTDSGATRTSYSIYEAAGADYTTVSNNVIYGTGGDTPLFSGTHSTFTELPVNLAGTADPLAPLVLYAPLLGQSNANLLKLSALDGGSGMSHLESGLLRQTNYSQVVTMPNLAVGGSTVDGNHHPSDTSKIWWYPVDGLPGPDLLQAVDQMQHQISALRTTNNVSPVVSWGQGEADAVSLGISTTDSGRLKAEQRYIGATMSVFNYIQEHVDPNVQFYIMETGLFNTKGALAAGYSQATIDMVDLGLTYLHDAQEKMALASPNIHLGVNYSDLPMNADVSSSVPNYQQSWAADPWHMSLDSKEIIGDRLANFIALDKGYIHVLDNPGSNYPHANLADFTIQTGLGLNIAGNVHDNIIVGTTGADIISGGGGNDIIIGGGGNDILMGGAGRDTFFYHPALLNEAQSIDTITDFQVGTGGDVIDVSALLKSVGYKGTKAVADGYITVTQQGADTIISFDSDGTAGNHAAVAIAQLSNTAASSFDLTNNLVTQFSSGNALIIAPLPVNHNPVAQQDDFTLMQDTVVVAGNVLVNNGHGADSDPDGNPLSIVAGTISTAHGGAAALTTAGDFTYTPATGFSGADTFSYTLLDGKGGQATGAVNLIINPPPINHDPVAQQDDFTLMQDTVVAGNVLVNNGHGADNDPDGDPLSVSAQSLATAHGGSVVLQANGDFTYASAQGYTGADTFSYSLLDGKGGQAAGSVNLTISSLLIVNHNPVAQPDNFTDSFNHAVIGNVLVNNGQGADSDPDGDPLIVTALTGQTTAGGNIDLHADGTFSYAPQLGFAGSDGFSYTLLDDHGGSASAAVAISVVAPLGAIVGTSGDNALNGGSRDDVILGLDGNDTLNGGGGNDTIYGGAGNDALNGNSGNDTLYAIAGNNTLHGNDDNDILYGGLGTDSLYGDNGNDLLIAGMGNTTMTGGGGADIFKFMSISGVTDAITDFRVSVGDKIDISNVLDSHDPASQAISDFVHATKQGANIILSVDHDGAANGSHFIDLAVLQGISSFDVTTMLASGNLMG